MKAFEWLGLAAIAVVGAVAAVVVWLVHREVAHPCVRFEVSTCSQCSLYSMISVGENMATPLCVVWEQVPCRVCAERAP